MRQISVVMLLFAAFCSASAQTLSPQVRGLVKVDAGVVALSHIRVMSERGTVGSR